MRSAALAAALAPQAEVHIAKAARATDPIVLACNACASVLVLGDEEDPPRACPACGARLCAGCLNRLREGHAVMGPMRADEEVRAS